MPRSAKHPGARNVWPIMAGQSVSLLGDYIALLAIPLFVLDLTGTGRDLGLAMAFETLPTLFFGFAAGVALDRISIRRALIVSDLARAAAFTLLAFSVLTGASQMWIVFAVAFLVGSMGVLFDAGLQSWLPALLDDDALIVVNSRLQIIRTAAWSIGPALAPFLIVVAGFSGAFLINAGTFVVSAAFIVVLVETRPREVVHHDRWWPSFREGIAYLWNQPLLRAATIAALVFNLTFIPLEALLVKFASESLDIPTGLMGWFYGGHALIGAFGVILAPRLIKMIDLGRTFIAGLAVLGAGFLTLTIAAPWVAALSPVWSVIIAIIPAGFAVAGVSVANVAFFTLRQTVPPQRLLGRVIAASRTLSWAGIPIGAGLGGFLGDALGLKTVYLGASMILLLVAWLLVPTKLWTQRSGPEIASTDWLRPDRIE